ncbi:NADAR family protein [Rhizobium ruizarguesonis]
MSSVAEFRTYDRDASIVFSKTNEAFGGLSNMAPGYPLSIGGFRIRTSEALYQACRFPHMPDIQRLIIEQSSPMTAKMQSKPYRKHSRADWDDIRVPIMKWCLRIKLVQNWDKFGDLLLATGHRNIVEYSVKDEYWGAKDYNSRELYGKNVLGRLLMDLREKVRFEPEIFEEVPALSIENFVLFGNAIPSIRLSPLSKPQPEEKSHKSDEAAPSFWNRA